jgi:polyisoprenoid-binding protein YceI
VEEHGDSAYSMEFIDAIRVNVHYTTTTSISVVSLASELSVYPNPASTQFTVDHLLPSTQRISLLDMSGRIVMEAMDFSSGQCTFNVADLPRGMYILQIANPEAGILTRKVVVQ